MEKASEVQVGGDHYKKMAYQPVSFIVNVRLNFLQGNICKYITRHRFKNGKNDVEKAKHYAQLAMELMPHTPLKISASKFAIEISKYRIQNKLTDLEASIIKKACMCHYDEAIAECDKLISLEYEQSK